MDYISDEEAQKAINEIDRLAEAFAGAKADRIYLEHYRKVQRALLFRNAGGKSVADREAESEADPKYDVVLKGIKSAVKDEEKFKLELRAHELRFEMWRTQSANTRRDRQRHNVESK